MENTFAPSGRSLPMSWERIKSQTSSSNFKYDFNSNQGRTLSGRMLSERAQLPSTIGGQSIHRYALEHNEPILEEPSHIERSHMTHSHMPLPNTSMITNAMLITNEQMDEATSFDQNS